MYVLPLSVYINGSVFMNGYFHTVLDIVQKLFAEAVDNGQRCAFKPHVLIG